MYKNMQTTGMSLLEILVASSILVIVVMSAMSFIITSQNIINEEAPKGNLEGHAQAVMDRLTNELRRASGSNLQISTETIQLKLIKDFKSDGTVDLQEDLITYQLMTLTNPTRHQLVRQEGTKSTVIAHNVVGSFEKVKSGSLHRVSLNLQFSKQIKGKTITTQVKTDIFIPNQS